MPVITRVAVAFAASTIPAIAVEVQASSSAVAFLGSDAPGQQLSQLVATSSPLQALEDAANNFVNHLNNMLDASASGGDPLADVENITYEDWLKQGLSNWVIWTVLGALVACCCYRHKAAGMDRGVAGSPQDIMSRGHFNCASDTETCICALLCPAVRWADTASMHGLMHFWPAFLLFAVFMLFNTLLHMFMTIGVATAVLLTYQRQHLRRRFGLPFCTFDTCLFDGFFTCFFPCCAIAQEARAVGVAYREGTLAGEPVMTFSKQYQVSAAMAGQGVATYAAATSPMPSQVRVSYPLPPQ